MKIEYNSWFIGFLLMGAIFCIPLHAQEEELLASAELEHVVILEPTFTSSRKNTTFENKYHYLVARSYFKLLAEAQKSERKLKLQFERYKFENQKFNRDGSLVFQRKLNLARNKYEAHCDMLSGLKSWNLFSDNRTGDMFYFMSENEEHIFKLYQKNVKEHKMVNYLIYRLADLYHLED